MCGEKEPFYTAGGNVNWYSHYGEQYGPSLKNQKRGYYMILQSHYWAYTQKKRKHNLKRHMHPSVHWSTIYNSQDMETT